MRSYAYGHLPAGTRIHHRRYTWMVGHVIGPVGREHAMVEWYNAPLASPRSECWSELRATPDQTKTS